MDFIRNNLFHVGGLELIPNSAEMHYWRVERKYWPFCFKQIKEAAFKIVSTCVPWNVHEYELEKFDFTGETAPQRDLLSFLRECRQMGFRVILKPGPWIGAEWKNGGLPDFVMSNPALVARDAADQPVHARSRVEVETTFAPCYTHPEFLKHVKRWYTALFTAIRDQIHPNGNVFLVQLDNDISHCYNSKPFDADYHDAIAKNLYPRYLKDRYKEIERLNSLYLSDYKDFAEVGPPRKIELKMERELTRFFDWVDFKEKYLATYVLQLRKMITDLGVDVGFCTNMRWDSDYSAPANWPMFEKYSGLAGVDVYWPHNYYEVQRYIRYLATTSRMPWAAEFMAGLWSNDPENAKKFQPIPEKLERFLILSSLAAGLRGANFSMFIERDHWHDSPVAADGRRARNWDFFKKLNEVINEYDFCETEKINNVGMVNYQPYTRYSYLDPEKLFNHLKDITRRIVPDLCTDLGQLGVDYTVVDPAVPESMEKQDVLFIPVADFLDDALVQTYAQLAQKGKHLVFFGVTPVLDLLMRKSLAFTAAFGVRSVPHFITEQVEWRGFKFECFVLGRLKLEEGWEPLLKDDRGNVYSARRKMGEGSVHFIGFNPASSLVPEKRLYTQSLLDELAAKRPVRVSEPLIEAFIKRSRKHMFMFLINPDESLREVVRPTHRIATVTFDIKLLNMHPDAITFIDLFTGEKRNEPLAAIRQGVQFHLENYDARMFEVIPEYGR